MRRERTVAARSVGNARNSFHARSIIEGAAMAHNNVVYATGPIVIGWGIYHHSNRTTTETPLFIAILS